MRQTRRRFNEAAYAERVSHRATELWRHRRKSFTVKRGRRWKVVQLNWRENKIITHPSFQCPFLLKPTKQETLNRIQRRIMWDCNSSPKKVVNIGLALRYKCIKSLTCVLSGFQMDSRTQKKKREKEEEEKKKKRLNSRCGKSSNAPKLVLAETKKRPLDKKWNWKWQNRLQIHSRCLNFWDFLQGQDL